MSRNYLTQNRATLLIDSIPDVNFSITSFNLPDINVGTIEVPTRFNVGKEGDDRLQFSDLVIEFIIDEDLKNWKQIYDWMNGIGIPISHRQYRGYSNRNLDGTMIIHSSHNNPITTIKFQELFPNSLSGPQFTEEEGDAVVRKSTVVFSLLSYTFN